MVKGMKLVFDRPVGLAVQRVKRNPFIRTPWSPYAFINSIDDRNSLQGHDPMMVFVFPIQFPNDSSLAFQYPDLFDPILSINPLFFKCSIALSMVDFPTCNSLTIWGFVAFGLSLSKWRTLT